MTNTTRPAQTATGIVCAGCSTGFGRDRKIVRHGSVADVRACFSTPVAPKVEVPTPAQQAELFTPEVVAVGRFFASCPRKGCKTHQVADRPFVLRCTDHGRKTVKTAAKQLFAQKTKSEHWNCDARCINAKGAECNCTCMGQNHGIGALVHI